MNERRPKLKYRGLKKFENKKMHKLEYRTKKWVDYKIVLFFESETHRHLASSYHQSLPSGNTRGPSKTLVGDPVPPRQDL